MSNMTATTIENKRMVFHSTCVAEIKDGKVVLDSGGWDTQTTKRRINQFFDMFGLPYYLYQERDCWYISKAPHSSGDPVLFYDGIELDI